MPGGIIRGALARLGFQAAVVPELSSLPQCMSRIKDFDKTKLTSSSRRYIPSEVTQGLIDCDLFAVNFGEEFPAGAPMIVQSPEVDTARHDREYSQSQHTRFLSRSRC